MSQFAVLTLEEYLALPELPIPAVADERALGVVYEVHKVGFFRASREACERRQIPADYVEDADGCLLPTVVIGKAGRKEFYRLPVSLSEWAVQLVATAHSIGNPLPCEVEFGILKDRHYAEMR